MAAAAHNGPYARHTERCYGAEDCRRSPWIKAARVEEEWGYRVPVPFVSSGGNEGGKRACKLCLPERKSG